MLKLLPVLLLLVACQNPSSPGKAGAPKPTIATDTANSNATVKPFPEEPLPKTSSKVDADDEPTKSEDSVQQSPHQGPGQYPSAPLTIKNLAFTGTGCPAGTVVTNVSPDAKAFTLVFAQFAAEILTGAKADAKRCNLTLTLAIPQGWQVSILSLDLRGFADIPKDADATLRTVIGFDDESSLLQGPHADPFHFRHETTLKTRAWSPCGREAALKIGVEAKLSSPNATAATLALDSLDGELRHEVGLAWRRCAS